MDQKEKMLVDYIIEKYHPKAIILSGSRASGKNREDSDWDLDILVDEDTKTINEEFDGQHIDIHSHTLPLSDTAIFKTDWSPYRDIKVLYDPKNIAESIVVRTRDAYNNGPQKLNSTQISNRHSKMQRILLKLKSSLNEPLIFTYHLGIFYAIAMRNWFELKNEWSIPLYDGVKEVKSRDKNFYELMEKISLESDLKTKADYCEKVIKSLFS